MCGRYSFVWLLDRLQDEFGSLKVNSEGFTRYNIAPGQGAPVIFEDDDSHRAVDNFRWGIVPHWAKERPGFSLKDHQRAIHPKTAPPAQKTSTFKALFCMQAASRSFETSSKSWWKVKGRETKTRCRAFFASTLPFESASKQGRGQSRLRSQ
ncbi:MAG TPA: SOS response-associated peptidase [Candidatus Diapherotrites archaeon]|uniref:SOS response-associated peptidase n=1 Tax=Candidatus Iainarchaeum sp. TaxID=3101447 RepID=A0A7J4J0E9_9ARCH|nr:SOS response-associated peptidase [Candidatus Diapherotrites archaeon]